MKFLEKDLEQIIFEADPKCLKFFNNCKHKKRQLIIPNYGIADLVLFEKIYDYHTDFINEKIDFSDVGIKITVCELKKDKIGISAFLQAIKYCKGIQDYLISRNFYSFVFDIVLIGKEIDESGSLKYLPDLINTETNSSDSFSFDCSIKSIDFYTYSYDFDGIKFFLNGIDLNTKIEDDLDF